MIEALIFFCIGLLILICGAEFLVRGASQLAIAMGISSLVVGLTIVAFGTGSPELLVSVVSNLSGEPDLSVGNVLGSNIVNVLLVLGACASVTPLVVHKQLIQRDVPMMVGASLLTLFLAWNGRITQIAGLGLLAILIVYTIYTVKKAREENHDVGTVIRHSMGWIARQVGYVILGIGLLALGARWLVASAAAIAQGLGVSELFIGLTIVAIGTSLPEAATSLMAAFKGERDMAVGNVVGSCIFNLLGVLGITAAISPEGLSISASALAFDFPVVIATAIACLPIFFTRHLISRGEGLLFLMYYMIYLCCLLFPNQLPTELVSALLFFVFPLTAITIGIGIARHWKNAP